MVDVEMIDVPKSFQSKGKGKAKAKVPKKHSARRIRVLDSDDVMDCDTEAESEGEEDDDEMSDFIVHSDEDEEEKNARRDFKKRLGKRKAIVVLDPDDEIEDLDTPEEKEVMFGMKKKDAAMSTEAIKLMPRFLPSTKMKVNLFPSPSKLPNAHGRPFST